jgi:hypothetical protein
VLTGRAAASARRPDPRSRAESCLARLHAARRRTCGRPGRRTCGPPAVAAVHGAIGGAPRRPPGARCALTVRGLPTGQRAPRGSACQRRGRDLPGSVGRRYSRGLSPAAPRRPQQRPVHQMGIPQGEPQMPEESFERRSGLTAFTIPSPDTTGSHDTEGIPVEPGPAPSTRESCKALPTRGSLSCACPVSGRISDGCPTAGRSRCASLRDHTCRRGPADCCRRRACQPQTDQPQCRHNRHPL